MFRFNHHHQGAYYLSLAKVIVIKIISYAYAATPPNQPQRCILTDYFNYYNFNQAQIICSLMMVTKPKHVGDVLM